MAVIETDKQKGDVRSVLFIAGLIVAFCVLAAGIYWLVKPAAPRQVKLSGKAAEQAAQSYVPPPVLLPAQPPIPQGADPGPTLITLDLKQVTPRQALQEIAKQAKVDLNAGNEGGGGASGFFAQMMSQRMDVSLKNEPFWPAFLGVAKQSNLLPYSEWNQPTRISLRQGGNMSTTRPSKAVGSSLIVLESITSRFDADLTGPRAPTRALNVNLQLYVEPKLKPYRISRVATIETAVDEKGTSLIAPVQPWADRQGGGPESVWTRDVDCNLLFPDSAGGRIARLKGYASIAVAGPEKTEKIDDPMGKKNVDVKIDGVMVRLVELRKRGGNQYEARMAGDINSPVFKEYEKFQKILKIVDANGKEFQHSGGSWGGGRGTTMDFGLMFTAPDGASEPKEARITLPTAMKEIRVPFEFLDLPLPH
jgi:hypothetical protein